MPVLHVAQAFLPVLGLVFFTALGVGVVVMGFWRFVVRLDRRRNDVLFAGPITQVDNLTTLATKWIELVRKSSFFFADRALHRVAARIGKSSGRTGKKPGGESMSPPIKS